MTPAAGSTMRAVRVHAYGGPQVLSLDDVAVPAPGEGQVLVDVAASGVNFRDVYEREGIYRIATPFGLGVEGAGTVAAVGSGVEDLAVGDRVAWAQAQGSYAEHVLLSAERAVRVPEGVPLETAAAAMLQGMTAHYLAVSTYQVQPGDDVLVHAGAGGVGLLLTQIVKRRGGRVIATVGSQAKRALATEAGADEVIGYDGFAEEVRRLTDGHGAAVAYDGVGKATYEGTLASLRVRGMFVLYGAASGQVPPFDLQLLNTGGSLYATRPTLAHYVATPADLQARAGEVLGWVADGSLQVRVGATYPLDDARSAHEDLEGRRTTGKVLLLP